MAEEKQPENHDQAGRPGAEAVTRMRLQNRFRTGLDIARYTAGIMRRDMAACTWIPISHCRGLPILICPPISGLSR